MSPHELMILNACYKCPSPERAPPAEQQGCMTTRRDEEALKLLADAITRAHPERVARVAADLAAEIEITETQTRDMAEAGEIANALTAASIAASITRIHRLFAGQGSEEEPQP